MKNIIPITIVGMLVLAGLGAAALNTDVSFEKTTRVTNDMISVVFSSQPILRNTHGFVEIELTGTSTQHIETNKPILPVYVKVFEIPFRSQNIEVVCTVGDVQTMSISSQVMPARVAPLSLMSEASAFVTDESVYSSDALYPQSWYTYELSSGRNDDNVVVTFVKVVCYPVRYSPAGNELVVADGFDIAVSYDAPVFSSSASEDSFDMVVIAPSAFEAALQPLITHKNDKGVITTFKSMEAILDEYTGFDPPEQVKYFIKDAYDNWNITYALLVGGLKSHIFAKDKDTRSAGYSAWHVPVRYMSIPAADEEGTLSDLYYGCLYDGLGDFDSWDSNGDGIYGAYGSPGVLNDVFDMNPEVYVGRLACTTLREVRVVVSKIINYEKTSQKEEAWYKNFVAIGGKTFAIYQGQPDGEYLGDLAMSYMVNTIPDLVPVKCYASNRDSEGLTPTPLDIIRAMRKGSGFVCFMGHGNPLSWNTIWHDGSYTDGDWTGGINTFLFPLINNRDKLPVVIVGGCHNGLYNITIIGNLLDKDGSKYFCYGTPFPVCFSWGLVVKPRGGAIASTGCTGYGFGSSGNPNTLSAALEMNFFWNIGNNSIANLGDAHSLSIRKYINENTMTQTGAFCITNWQLFGDPSLRFGGYSS